MYCPVCGNWAGRVSLSSGLGIGTHLNPQKNPCWIDNVPVDYARVLGEILEKDPLLPLRAHP